MIVIRLLLVVAAACSPAPTLTPPPAAPAIALQPAQASSQAPSPAELPEWVSVDSVGRIVTLTLDVLPGGPEGVATLNGLLHGAVQLVVPLGWTIKWIWTNRDSTQSHSLVVMSEREKLPTEGGRPALENALSRAVLTGLKPGQRDLTTFLADQAGWYWVLCGVPNHAIRGEWIGLKIDPAATGVGVVLK